MQQIRQSCNPSLVWRAGAESLGCGLTTRSTGPPPAHRAGWAKSTEELLALARHTKKQTAMYHTGKQRETSGSNRLVCGDDYVVIPPRPTSCLAQSHVAFACLTKPHFIPTNMNPIFWIRILDSSKFDSSQIMPA